MKAETIAAVLLLLIFLFLALGLANYQAPPNDVTFTGGSLAIYPPGFAWGTVKPGLNYTSPTVYILNRDSPAMTLSFNCSGWTPPAAEQFLHLSWDYQNEMLQHGEQVEVHFTLAVASDVSGFVDFKFNVTIYGQ